jgi:hypothetical protein
LKPRSHSVCTNVNEKGRERGGREGGGGGGSEGAMEREHSFSSALKRVISRRSLLRCRGR